jgi:hypothetical protein
MTAITLALNRRLPIFRGISRDSLTAIYHFALVSIKRRPDFVLRIVL